MTDTDLVTTGEIALMFNVSHWAARRAVDAVQCDVRRVGLYRVVPRANIGIVGAELARRALHRKGREVVANVG